MVIWSDISYGKHMCEKQHMHNERVWNIKHGLVHLSLAAGPAARRTLSQHLPGQESKNVERTKLISEIKQISRHSPLCVIQTAKHLESERKACLDWNRQFWLFLMPLRLSTQSSFLLLTLLVLPRSLTGPLLSAGKGVSRYSIPGSRYSIPGFLFLIKCGGGVHCMRSFPLSFLTWRGYVGGRRRRLAALSRRINKLPKESPQLQWTGIYMQW